MNAFDRELENIEKSRLDGIKSKVFLLENEEVLKSCRFHITFSGSNTRLIITKLSDLTEARKFMRKLYGTWKDELGNVFFSSNAIATWVDENHDWSIWLECSVEDFPKELVGDSCEWVESTQSDYHMQCSL